MIDKITWPPRFTDEELAASRKLEEANDRVDGLPTRMIFKGERFQKKVLSETSIAVFDDKGLKKLIPISEYLADPASAAPCQAASSTQALRPA